MSELMDAVGLKKVQVGDAVALATLSYKSAHLRIGKVIDVQADGYVKVAVWATNRSVTQKACRVAVIG